MTINYQWRSQGDSGNFPPMLGGKNSLKVAKNDVDFKFFSLRRLSGLQAINLI